MSRRSGALAVLALAGLSAVAAFVHVLHHDVAYLQFVSRRLLEGDRLYRDFVAPNLPTAFYLNAVPAWLGRATGWDDIVLLKLVVLAVGAASLGLCAGLLRRDLETGDAWLLVAALVAAFGLVPFGIGGADFGHREHWAVLLLTPYVLAHAGRSAGRPPPLAPALGVAALAGIGFALKPHFALLWLVLEGWTLWRALRGARPPWRDAILPAGVAAVIGAAIWVRYPEYPGVVRTAFDVYAGYRSGSFLAMLAEPRSLLSLAGLALAAVALRRARSPQRIALLRSLALATVAWLAVAVGQRKGWAYQFLPAAATAVVLGVACVDTLAARRPGVRTAVAAGLLGLALWSALLAFVTSRSGAREFAAWLSERAGGGSVLVLSTSILPAFPAVAYAQDVGWALRLPCLWALPGLYTPTPADVAPFPYREPSEMGSIERWQLDAVLGDLADHRPELVMVDVGRVKLGLGSTHFDFLEYLSRDPRFRRAFCPYLRFEPRAAAGAAAPPGYAFYRRDAERARRCAAEPGAAALR